VYECGVTRRFTAKHALVGDFGNDLAELEGKSDEVVRSLLSYPSLNQVPGIKGKNPSAENLAVHVLESIAQRIDLRPLDSLTVSVWESESAWASCISSAEEQRGKAAG
jgi:hypothetical protein